MKEMQKYAAEKGMDIDEEVFLREIIIKAITDVKMNLDKQKQCMHQPQEDIVSLLVGQIQQAK